MWSGDFEYIITFEKYSNFTKILSKTDFANYLKVFIKSRNLIYAKAITYIRITVKKLSVFYCVKLCGDT